MSPRHALVAALALTSATTGPGCHRRDPETLPPEDDLYGYAVAVAERARHIIGADDYLATYHVARAHQRFGLEDAALEVFEEATKLTDDASLAYREIGYILSNRSGRMDEAVAAYRSALRCDPDLGGIRTRIGLILIHQSRLPEAVEVLEEEVKNGTADDMTFYNLGTAYQQQKLHEKAVEHFSRAPEMREALFGLAKSLDALGRKDEARAKRQEYKKLKDELHEAELASDIASREVKSDIEDRRRFTAEVWGDASLAFVQAYNRESGAAYERRARLYGEALDAMREALRFHEQYLTAYQFLIGQYRAQENLPLAIEYNRRAVRAFPEEPVLRFQLAGLLIESAPTSPPRPGDPSWKAPDEVTEGIGLLEETLELKPDFAEAHRELARAILRLDPVPELLPKALDHARRALELSGGPQPLYYDYLAYAYDANGLPAKALETLEAGAKRYPDAKDLVTRLEAYRRRLGGPTDTGSDS